MANVVTGNEFEERLFTIDDVLLAHLGWRRQFIGSIIDDKVAQNVAATMPEDSCPVGRWLVGLTLEQRSQRHYEKVFLLHEQFHLEAGCLLSMGPTSATVGEQWSRMDQISDQLINALEAWRNDAADSRLRN